MKNIFCLFSSLADSIRRFGTFLGLLGAVVLLAAAVTAGFFVPTKALGVPLASVGGFAAGGLFFAFLKRNERVGEADRATMRELREELSKRTDRIAWLENAVAERDERIGRLEKRRIDVNAVRPILKLGLVEADMSVKDVQIAWMDDFDKGGWLASPSRSQYVGVLQRSFKATYGVDLSKLLLREDEDCIRVAGIAPESLGFKDDSSQWLLRQTQKYGLKKASGLDDDPERLPVLSARFKKGNDVYEIDRTADFTGTLDREATADFCDRQEKELQRRLNMGVGEEFRNVNRYIRHMAEGFIRVLLSPVNKPVVFVDTPLSEIEHEVGWFGIEDFAKEHNRLLESDKTEATA